jgi:hypothetical protein
MIAAFASIRRDRRDRDCDSLEPNWLQIGDPVGQVVCDMRAYQLMCRMSQLKNTSGSLPEVKSDRLNEFKNASRGAKS